MISILSHCSDKHIDSYYLNSYTPYEINLWYKLLPTVADYFYYDINKKYNFSPEGKLYKKLNGGRCNVTHHVYEAKKLCNNYPRGEKELLSPFLAFQVIDTIKWFADRGIQLKRENDGRMFPVTDNSRTIIDCFMNEAIKSKIKLLNKAI